MTRVTSIDAGQVITTGLVNMRRFEQRPIETLVLAELLDRTVELRDGAGPVTIEDVGDRAGPRPGVAGSRRASSAAVRPPAGPAGCGGAARRSWSRSRSSTVGVVEQRQGAANLLAAFEELKAADLAEVIHELPPKRRLEVAAALDDERLADVLEELPEDDQVAILSELEHRARRRRARGDAAGRRRRPARRAAGRSRPSSCWR